MLIRTTIGNYIHWENVTSIIITELPSGDYSVTAFYTGGFSSIAMFHNKAEAQEFLDKFVKNFGERVIVADMAEWNYTGHKKDHKETRHGGS